MKKLFTFLIGAFIMTLCNLQFANAQTYWNDYVVNENFNGITTMPTSLTTISGTTSVIGRSGAVTVGNDLVTFGGGSGGGNRGAELAFTSTAGRNLVVVEFDWSTAGAQVTYRNAAGVYLLGSNNVIASDETAHSDVVFGIYVAGSGSHLNVWNKGFETAGLGAVFTQGGGFGRCHTTNVDSVNAPAVTNVAHTVGKVYHIKAELNFTSKIVTTLTITEIADPTNTETLTNLPFVSSTAVDVARIGINQSRGSDCGNGNTVQSMALTLDNLQVYERVESQGTADVTIKYEDYDGVEAKVSRTAPEQEVGLSYSLLASDKESFMNNGFYYAFDETATGAAGTITVGLNPSQNNVIAKFKKTAVTTATYTWRGDLENWNELENAFTTDGTNSIAYQDGNPVAFSDANALIKEVTLDGTAKLGTANVTVSAPDYILKGAGTLVGTGAYVVNTSTTIGVKNEMTEGVELNAGTLEITNSAAGTKYVVTEGAILNVNSGAAFSAPIIGFGGQFDIVPTSTVSYTSAITGIDVLNIALPVKGNVTTSAFSYVPRLYNTFSGTLNITANETDTCLFASTTQHAATKINLGDRVNMVYSENPANASGASATVVNIGELKGTAESFVYGPRIREVNYKVGGLNTDATFAGKFNQYGLDQWSGQPKYNIYKVGTGTWTLTGNSENWNGGNLFVVDGTLVVDGVLGTGTSIPELVVSDSATLVGTGSIAVASTTIRGTVSGNLNFGSSIALTDTAKFVVTIDGNNSSSITTPGDFYYGGKLVVKIANAPTASATYKIIDAQGGYIPAGDDGFVTLSLPSDRWSFDWMSGVLSYTQGASVNNVDANKVVQSVEYFDAVGRKINKEESGVVVEKITYTDGTSAINKRVLLKNR